MCKSFITWKETNADFIWFVLRHIVESLQLLSVLAVAAFEWYHSNIYFVDEI